METKLSKICRKDANQQSIVKNDKKLGSRYLLTVSLDKSVKQFNIENQQEVDHYKGIHQNVISAATLRPY